MQGNRKVPRHTGRRPEGVLQFPPARSYDVSMNEPATSPSPPAIDFKNPATFDLLVVGAIPLAHMIQGANLAAGAAELKTCLEKAPAGSFILISVSDADARPTPQQVISGAKIERVKVVMMSIVTPKKIDPNGAVESHGERRTGGIFT